VGGSVQKHPPPSNAFTVSQLKVSSIHSLLPSSQIHSQVSAPHGFAELLELELLLELDESELEDESLLLLLESLLLLLDELEDGLEELLLDDGLDDEDELDELLLDDGLDDEDELDDDGLELLLLEDDELNELEELELPQQHSMIAGRDIRQPHPQARCSQVAA